MKWADKWKEEEVQVYEAAFKLYVEDRECLSGKYCRPYRLWSGNTF